MKPELVSEGAIRSWWATLSPEQRTTVLHSIEQNDMRVGNVYGNLRQLEMIKPFGQHLRDLGVIEPLVASADVAGRRHIPWPEELVEMIHHLAFPQS
jgi:hypothetical protein